MSPLESGILGLYFLTLVILAILAFTAGKAGAQDELRETFFKEADAAKAAADAADANLLPALEANSYLAMMAGDVAATRHWTDRDLEASGTDGDEAAVVETCLAILGDPDAKRDKEIEQAIGNVIRCWGGQ